MEWHYAFKENQTKQKKKTKQKSWDVRPYSENTFEALLLLKWTLKDLLGIRFK